MSEVPCSRKVRVLLADDSAVMRTLLRMVLEPQPCLEIVAAATNGQEALAAFERLHPDLVLLDIEMPGMNGLEVLSGIRRRNRRVPVLMCSTLTWRGARITLEALARGATDYVTKPGAQSGLRQGVETLTRDLIPKILALFPRNPEPVPATEPRRTAPIPLPPPVYAPRVVVIGVSTGGPAALEALLPKIPAGFPLPVLIVQHMPRLFTGLLADRLNSQCALRVREAAPDVRPEPGVVDIARGDWHLELTRDFRLRLNQSEPENFCRPSVDVLFRSAALACSGRVLGIILTGMGSDGLAGCQAIRAAGGTVFAQDAATSVIWGMPGAVANAGLASKILPLDAIPAEILRLLASTRAQPPQPAAVAL
ncbi:MAG TPA: chemotaxis response regulator protein-glutamate methylesterase [Acidobacteriaceae bacterium]|jgi:two-component system chemotaxis response regulator CheB